MLNKFILLMNILLLVILGVIIGNNYFKGDEQSWNDMFSYSLNCEASAIEEINFTGAIGEMRRARHCVIRHGDYTEWLNDKLVMKGQYINGKKVGTWYWYNESGDIVTTKEY